MFIVSVRRLHVCITFWHYKIPMFLYCGKRDMMALIQLVAKQVSNFIEFFIDKIEQIKAMTSDNVQLKTSSFY